MIISGDDIRDRRIQAERDASFDPSDHRIDVDYYPAQASLALWVIAEQLFEIRKLLGLASEVLDVGSGADFPGAVRVRIHHQEER